MSPPRLPEEPATSARWTAFSGNVLQEVSDPELQAVVSELAAAVDVPIALVSLVLRRTQYFKAHVGLPPDLQASRATDRDTSFCQFVVRDGKPFEVRDAQSDDRVPQALVEAYGIRAYLGFPVKVGGHVLGSLCAIDTEPREFSAQDRQKVERLAVRASSRLTQLSQERSQVASSSLSTVARPAFAELRNVLMPLVHGPAAWRVALGDVRALIRLAQGGFGQSTAERVLQDARNAVTDLEQVTEEVAESAHRIQELVVSLERTLSPGTRSVSLGACLTDALALATHQVRLSGGARVVHPLPGALLGCPAIVATSTLAGAFSAISLELHERRRAVGIDVSCDTTDEAVEVRFTAPGCPEVAVEALARVGPLVEGDPQLSVRVEGESLVVCLARPGA